MNASELYSLIEPVRERMVKCGVWPLKHTDHEGTQRLEPSGWDDEGTPRHTWDWIADDQDQCDSHCDAQEAENALQCALVEWAIKAGGDVYWKLDKYRIFFEARPEDKYYDGPTLLHALVAAFDGATK